jgi:hypothetical protein
MIVSKGLLQKPMIAGLPHQRPTSGVANARKQRHFGMLKNALEQ